MLLAGFNILNSSWMNRYLFEPDPGLVPPPPLEGGQGQQGGDIDIVPDDWETTSTVLELDIKEGARREGNNLQRDGVMEGKQELDENKLEKDEKVQEDSKEKEEDNIKDKSSSSSDAGDVVGAAASSSGRVASPNDNAIPLFVPALEKQDPAKIGTPDAPLNSGFIMVPPLPHDSSEQHTFKSPRDEGLTLRGFQQGLYKMYIAPMSEFLFFVSPLASREEVGAKARPLSASGMGVEGEES